MKKYAISDIHGHLKTFELLLDTINYNPEEDELYILGDMIDRGADSRGVMDKLMDLQADNRKVFCLKGNHEQMMLLALEDSDNMPFWLKHGGKETAQNFQNKEIAALDIPNKYIHFMENLPHFFDVDDYILVHAGLNFRTKEPLSDIESMMWIRNWYDSIDADFVKEKYIIHGHTPTSKTEITHQFENLEKDRILNIDNGCTYPRPGLNQLCAFDLTDKKLTFVPNIG